MTSDMTELVLFHTETTGRYTNVESFTSKKKKKLHMSIFLHVTKSLKCQTICWHTIRECHKYVMGHVYTYFGRNFCSICHGVALYQRPQDIVTHRLTSTQCEPTVDKNRSMDTLSSPVFDSFRKDATPSRLIDPSDLPSASANILTPTWESTCKMKDSM